MAFSLRALVWVGVCATVMLGVVVPAVEGVAPVFDRDRPGEGRANGRADAWLIKFTDDIPDEDLEAACETTDPARKLLAKGGNGGNGKGKLKGKKPLWCDKKKPVQKIMSVLEADIDAVLAEYDGMIEYAEPNGKVVALGSTSSWALDRLDQADLPLDGMFNPASDGAGVHVYIVDTGIDSDHPEFTGRVGAGYDFVNDDTNPEDCEGHGTHCAGLALGTTWGVAKGATLHGVRVLGCTGGGTYYDVIAGVDWVARQHSNMYPGTRAVMSMSLGGGASTSMNNAVDAATAMGVPVVVAAGNDAGDACRYSPAGAATAVTVGSTTSSDTMSSFSNYGSCIDIFAPGSNIVSARMGGGQVALSGTSMACPLVAGAVALYMGENPNADGATAVSEVYAAARVDKLTGIRTSPNKLLSVDFPNKTPTAAPTKSAPTTSPPTPPPPTDAPKTLYPTGAPTPPTPSSPTKKPRGKPGSAPTTDGGGGGGGGGGGKGKGKKKTRVNGGYSEGDR